MSDPGSGAHVSDPIHFQGACHLRAKIQAGNEEVVRGYLAGAAQRSQCRRKVVHVAAEPECRVHMPGYLPRDVQFAGDRLIDVQVLHVTFGQKACSGSTHIYLRSPFQSPVIKSRLNLIQSRLSSVRVDGRLEALGGEVPGLDRPGTDAAFDRYVAGTLLFKSQIEWQLREELF